MFPFSIIARYVWASNPAVIAYFARISHRQQDEILDKNPTWHKAVIEVTILSAWPTI